LSRLRDWDDRGGWQEFFDAYWHLIYGLARKCGLSDAESEDVVQETLIAVAKQIPDFRYDPSIGSFKGWLFEIARCRIADQFRRRLPRDAGCSAGSNHDQTATIDKLPDLNAPDLTGGWDRDWEHQMLRLAIEHVKSRISPKQFQMFDLYVTQEWPMAAVVQALGVHRAQVYMAKHRVGRLIKREVERLTRFQTPSANRHRRTS
jgi:RNA polymerase sigma-70 factor (ECF subfamily)